MTPLTPLSSPQTTDLSHNNNANMMKRIALLTALVASTSAFTSPILPQTARLTSTSVFGKKDKKDGEDAPVASGAEEISALTAGVKTIFSLEDIAKILPHRYPFLLVDKVVEYEMGKVSTLEC